MCVRIKTSPDLRICNVLGLDLCSVMVVLMLIENSRDFIAASAAFKATSFPGTFEHFSP